MSAAHLPFPLRSDSYKLTHWRQYPPGTTEVYSYFESRGGAFPETVFFGLQYYLRAYLTGCVVRVEDVDAADRFAEGHFGRAGLFHREGWLHIVDDHAGRLPVEIRAVCEGIAIPARNVLMTIRNTCPRCFWLTNFLETMLVKVWYPSTVCTLSREIHQTLRQALAHTGEDLALADSMLHDFGYRGTSSEESAAIGGAAHLVHFRTSDTLAANFLLREHYAVGDPDWIPSTSVPAAEHSTITAWGREHEVDAYRAMLNAYPTGVVSIVADSYDIFRAAREIFGGVLRSEVLARDGVLVLRPDSGDPKAVLSSLLSILADRFGSQLNRAGYRRLHPKIRLLWGDGIDLESLRQILAHITTEGWSAANLIFGMGGGLLQKVDRDLQRFAFKCSSVTVNGTERAIWKDPATDHGKSSKAGKLALICEAGEYRTVRQTPQGTTGDLLEVVFRDGELLRQQRFDDVRHRAGAQRS